jgi:hypothetical protein
MTVSKFLHFYNPGLFPIYDNAVIWDKVLRRFRNDFRDFCISANIPYEVAMKDDHREIPTLLRVVGKFPFVGSSR